MTRSFENPLPFGYYVIEWESSNNCVLLRKHWLGWMGYPGQNLLSDDELADRIGGGRIFSLAKGNEVSVIWTP